MDILFIKGLNLCLLGKTFAFLLLLFSFLYYWGVGGQWIICYCIAHGFTFAHWPILFPVHLVNLNFHFSSSRLMEYGVHCNCSRLILWFIQEFLLLLWILLFMWRKLFMVIVDGLVWYKSLSFFYKIFWKARKFFWYSEGK